MNFYEKIDSISALLGLGKNNVPGIEARTVRRLRQNNDVPGPSSLKKIVRETNREINERRRMNPKFGEGFEVTLEELTELANIARLDSSKREALASLPVLLGRLLNGIATVGLDGCVKFKPSHLRPEELLNYCLPVRVVLEEDLQRSRATQKLESSGESDYLTSTHEEFARNEAALRLPRFALNRILDSARDHILLRGEPGEGKSTGLWLHLAESCRQLLQQLELDETAHDQSGFSLPLILPLKYLQQRSSVNQIKDQRAPSVIECAIDYALGLVDLSEEEVVRVRQFMAAKVKKRQFRLLLDGLDELPISFHEDLRKSLRSLDGVRVVMTARLNVDDRNVLLNPLRLRMVCFWPREVQEFLKRYFAQSPDRRHILRNIEQRLRLSPGVRALSQIPLLLAMLCYRLERDANSPIPNSRTELLRDGLLSLMERGDEFRGLSKRPLRNQAKIRVVAELAWLYYERGPLILEPAGIAACIDAARTRWSVLASTTADDLLGELTRDGVLLEHRNGYSFALRSFHEFGVAMYLGGLCHGGCSRDEVIQMVRGDANQFPHQPLWRDFKPLNQPGWLHIWPLAAGCAAPRPWIVEALADETLQNEDCLSGRTILLAHALGEFANQPTVSYSVNKVGDSILPWLMDRLIGQLGGDRLRDQELEPYATAFAQLPTPLGAKRLTERMSDRRRSEYERCNYAFVLGEFALPIAINALEKTLNDPLGDDGKLPALCAASLGRIGTDRAKRSIISRLTSKDIRDPWLKLGCLSALERFGDNDYSELLNAMMRDDKCHVDLRAHAVTLAAKMTWPQCGAKILDVLAHPRAARDRDDYHLRECCLKALGELGTPEARDALLNWLKERPLSDALAIEAIRALACIGDSISVITIERIAGQTKEEIRVPVQIELARLGDVKVRAALRKLVRRPGLATNLAEAIIRFLAIAASEEDVETLSAVMNTRGIESLRIQAAQGLGKCGTVSAVAGLEKAAKYSKTSESLRWTCAIEGTRAASETCRTILLAQIHGSSADATKLRKAIDALAADASSEARDTLVELIQHQNEHVRSAVRSALWQIQRKIGHRWLQSGAWEAP